MVFALYVQWHGDFGPGGGFQAGVIFAAGYILYALIFDVDTARMVVPAWATRLCLALGVLLYAGVGVVSLLMGGDFLDYSMLADDPVKGQHLGILLVEFGVGLTVAAAMIAIFFTFARQER
jgi:multicomponent Na+:H+ antiporter subunit B